MLTFINAIYIADSVKSVNFAFDLRGALERCRPIQKARGLSQCESILWSDARVAEEARLESVYTPKAYPEFESRSLRLIDRFYNGSGPIAQLVRAPDS